MQSGRFTFRQLRGINQGPRMQRARLSLVRGTLSLLVIGFSVSSRVCRADATEGPSGGGGTFTGNHNEKPQDCPEGMRPPQNCDDIRQMAYKLGTAKKGYMDGSEYGKNGIPDVMERPYVRDQNDCSTGNAHMACMFNDPCTAQYGELLGMRSDSAKHATTLYRGRDGTQFECDFTPQSSGISIRRNADARTGPAHPDPGESIDPAYNCDRNGAGYSALNAGGPGDGGSFGGAGGMGNLGNMLALLQILQNMQSGQNNNGSSLPPYNDGSLLPQPTPTATPTAPQRAPELLPTPPPQSSGSGRGAANTTLNPGFAPLDFGAADSKQPQKEAESASFGTNSQEDLLAKDRRDRAMWEDDRGDIFGSRK
jgi:hypothetical protein